MLTPTCPSDGGNTAVTRATELDSLDRRLQGFASLIHELLSRDLVCQSGTGSFVLREDVQERAWTSGREARSSPVVRHAENRPDDQGPDRFHGWGAATGQAERQPFQGRKGPVERHSQADRGEGETPSRATPKPPHTRIGPRQGDPRRARRQSGTAPAGRTHSTRPRRAGPPETGGLRAKAIGYWRAPTRHEWGTFRGQPTWSGCRSRLFRWPQQGSRRGRMGAVR